MKNLKETPQIKFHMTPLPHSIGLDIPIKTAIEMMREFHVRHLPVKKGGKLVGILTDRDLKLAASFKDAAELTVEEVMTPDPYTVEMETPLNTVATAMAEHKYGCALITDAHGSVVGIFTSTDGMKLLSRLSSPHTS